MDRYKHKALHVGRECHKFRFDFCALEASGLPVSAQAGEIALTLQRGVKAARTQPARAQMGVARWHGQAGVASLVVTLYKSNDKGGTGKSYSSKPYRIALVALAPSPGATATATATAGASGARPKRLTLPGTLGARPGGAGSVELGLADLDLAKLAPASALLSPASSPSSAAREIELHLPARTGGAARVRLSVRVHALARDGSGSGNHAGAFGASPAPPVREAGGAARARGGDRADDDDDDDDDDDGDDDDSGSVSSRLAHLALGREAPGAAERASRGGGGGGGSDGGAPPAEPERQKRDAYVDGLVGVREGLEAELNRRRSQRGATPQRGGEPGSAPRAAVGTPGASAAALTATATSELLRVRDENSALCAQLEQLRGELDDANTRAAHSELLAQRARDAADAAAADAAAREERADALAARLAGDDALAGANDARAAAIADARADADAAEARATSAEYALRAARVEIADVRARLDDEAARRGAAEEEMAAARAAARSSTSRGSSSPPPAPPSDDARRAAAATASADALRLELASLRAEWDDALRRVSSSHQLKLDRLTVERDALEARETELTAAIEAAHDDAHRERARATDALRLLDEAREELAVAKGARATAEAEASARDAARAEAARALLECRAELARAREEVAVALAGAHEATAAARLGPSTPSAGGGGGDLDVPADDAAQRELDASEQEERLFELTLELVDAKMRLAESELERDRAVLAAKKAAQRAADDASGSRAVGFELGVELTALEVKNARLAEELGRARARIVEIESAHAGAAARARGGDGGTDDARVGRAKPGAAERGAPSPARAQWDDGSDSDD